MTGPEHFRAGEDALSRAAHLDPQADKESARLHTAILAEATAHFAAAEAACYGALVADGDLDGVSAEWKALLGVKADGE